MKNHRWELGGEQGEVLLGQERGKSVDGEQMFLKGSAQTVFDRPRPRCDRNDGVDESSLLLLDHLPEQGFAGSIEGVEGPFGDPCSSNELVHCRAAHTGSA